MLHFSDLTSIGIGTGEYLFQGLIPGEYIVRFIYGSTDETVLSEKAVVIKQEKLYQPCNTKTRL